MVNLWMSWMSILDKNPKKGAKNNKLKNTKYQNFN